MVQQLSARKQKKIFFCMGLPALAFYFFVATIYFAFIGGAMAFVFLVGVCCLRKKDFWVRANKLALAMFGIYILLVPNPLMWPQQIERHINPALLITPGAPEVQDLNSTNRFWDWISTTEGLSVSQFEALDEPTKLRHLSDYCLFVVNWTDIAVQYGVIARVATPAEAITSGHGDCQAQTVTTTSLLIYLGYNAYAAETPLHWYTVVYLANGTPVYLDRIVGELRLTASDPELLLNDKGMWYTKNWATLFPDIVFNPHLNRNFLNTALQNPIIWTFLPVALLGAGILLKLIISVQDRPKKKVILKEGIYTGGMLNSGFLLATGLSFATPLSTLLVLIVAIVVAVQVTSHNFFLGVSGKMVG